MTRDNFVSVNNPFINSSTWLKPGMKRRINPVHIK